MKRKILLAIGIPGGIVAIILLFFSFVSTFKGLRTYKEVMDDPDALMNPELSPEEQAELDKYMKKVEGDMNMAMIDFLTADRKKILLRAGKAKKMIQKNPKDAAAHLRLGLCYRDLGMIQGAENEITLAIKYDQDYAAAHYALGDLYSKNDDRLQEAYNELQRAIALDSRNPLVKNRLSYVKKALHRRAKDLSAQDRTELQQVSHEKDKTTEVTKETSAKAQDKEEKQEHTTNAVNTEESRQHVKYVYQQFVSFPQARKYLNQIQKNDAELNAHLGLAFYYKNSRRYDKALEHFEKVVSYNPKHVVASYQLGILYAKEKATYDKAIEYLQVVVKADPENTFARNLLQSLKKKMNK